MSFRSFLILYRNKLLVFLKSKCMCIFLSFLCLILLFSLNTILWYTTTEIKDPHDRSGLILDTPGCKIPKLDPYDETVKHMIQIRKPYVCKGDPVFMTAKPNSVIILNDTILNNSYNLSAKDISCFYKAINRVKPTAKSKRENEISFGKSVPLKFGVPLGEEFVEVHCKLGSKNFTQYIPLVPIKPELEKKALKAEVGNTNLLNVILIGIDSISKLNFLRHFKKTHSFLTSHVSALDMVGYTKVADNTFPNLVPMLTGHFIQHYWNESLKNKMFFDNLDFIWKVYSKKGYRTFFAEDMPKAGTFQYVKRGFENPPTDYYYRPMALAVDRSDLKKKDWQCLNNQMEAEMIYKYLKDYVKTMEGRPYFAFSMISTLTHDYVNNAGYADEPTFKLLDELWQSGAINRSMVVLFSDHGIRFGKIRETYIGKIEERMPFMYLIFPDWFLEKHGSISRNLKINQNRLITLFDLHATLYHLLDISKNMEDDLKSVITPNGLSLFNEISEYRTCEMANILTHWCPCQTYQYVALNDKIILKVADALIRNINELLEPYVVENICARLEIEEITDARIGQVNDIILRFMHQKNDVINRYVAFGDKVSTLDDYLITIRARPGGGMFEGTVRHDVKNDKLKVLGISRINMYGKQSACINSQNLKKFCFCS